MAPRLKQAFTSSADVLWFGEPPEGFREQVNLVLAIPLSDEAWGGLCSVMRGYSMLLNHEVAAVPLTVQRKSVEELLSSTNALLDKIEEVDRPEMGSVVRARISDRWEMLYDHAAEFDREVGRMEQDMVAAFEFASHPAPEEQASQLIRDWKWNGRLVRPDMPADFVVLLHEFREAVRIFAGGLSKGTEYYETQGSAWMEFIGQLTEWASANAVPTWVSKSETSGASPFQALVKAILALVPEIRDENGVLAERQMRRAMIADTSLADSIIDARKEYEARRPLGGDSAATA